jgi:hypothetical protein
MKTGTVVLSALIVLLTSLLSAEALAQTNPGCSVRDPDLQGTYEGDCIGGAASGKGRAVGKDRYEGGFREGQPTGYGVYTKANGQRAEGEFVDGKLNGRGKVYSVNGDILEGQFSDSHLVGIGKLMRKTGEVIDVELRDGKLARASSATATNPQPAQGSAGAESAAATVKWAPRLDLDDLFPSYILASATRKPPTAPATPQAPRGDPLSLLATILQAAAGAQPAQAQAPSNQHYLGDRWGLVGVQIRTTEPNADVVVSVSIDEVAEPTSVRFKLDAPGDYLLYPKLKYKYDKLRAVTQPIPVNITWNVTVNGKPAGSQMRVATLRSVYDAPIQVQTARGAENLSWVFAAYVTEDAPWIDKLLQETLQRRHVKAFTGYQQGPQEALRQVEAVYDVLKHRGVRYSSITTSSASSQKVFSQVVRFPLDSVNNAQANCIDGTVLMASVLRKIGLDPIIILGPGHAMLGYSTTGSPNDGIKVIETTMIGTASFADALRAGSAKYSEWATNYRQDPRFKLIRVADARQQGVMPIPR